MQQGRNIAGRATGQEKPERTLHAAVNWAVLGLVIEKPSYGYEIGQRFTARFGGFVPASLSNIYTTLDRLVRMGFVEPTHTQAATSSGRQHKLHYRATSEGARAYRAWLARRLRKVDERSELLLRLLSVCLRGVPALDDVLQRYEHECLQEQHTLGQASHLGEPGDPELMPALLARMIDAERRLMLEAQLTWVRSTRAELHEHLERQRRRAAIATGRAGTDA
jgi:DNA-binding PadR family transcriptional regulator